MNPERLKKTSVFSVDMRQETHLNEYVKRLGILLAIIGAVYIIMSTTCPLVPCQDIDPMTGKAFMRMCPVQACAHGYIYAGLTLWLVGAVLWVSGVYITPELASKWVSRRVERYEKRRGAPAETKPARKKTSARKTTKKAKKAPARKKTARKTTRRKAARTSTKKR